MNSFDLLPNPETTLRVISDLVRHVQAPDVTEQRISVRQQLLQPIIVQPLSDTFEPVGDRFSALSRDVSVAGVGFFATDAIEFDFLQIDFVECKDATVIVELIHQRQLGPFWVIGSKLLVNWSDADWDALVE